MKVTLKNELTTRNKKNLNKFNVETNGDKNDISVKLPRGLFGFSQEQNFLLKNFPQNKFSPFRVLYNPAAPDYSFIVLPAESLNGFALSDQEKNKTASFYGIDEKSVKILYIVTIQNSGSSYEITANLRAPIVLDKDNNLAWQHILDNPDYKVDYSLAAISETIKLHKDN